LQAQPEKTGLNRDVPEETAGGDTFRESRGKEVASISKVWHRGEKYQGENASFRTGQNQQEEEKGDSESARKKELPRVPVEKSRLAGRAEEKWQEEEVTPREGDCYC